MATYLGIWEVDHTKIPIDAKERGKAWAMLMAMVKKDIEKGIVKSFGAFVGETRGYAVYEGTELEVMNTIQQYMPFVTYKMHPVATESQVNAMIKALTG